MAPEKHTQRYDSIKIDPIGCYQKADGKVKRKRRAGFRQNRKTICVFCLTCLFVFGILAKDHVIVLFGQYKIMSSRMERIVQGEYHQLLSTPVILKTGMSIEKKQVYQQLSDLGYKSVPTTRVVVGQFFQGTDRLLLHQRESTLHKDRLLVLDLKDKVIELISDAGSGVILPEVDLGRIRLTSFLDEVWEERRPVDHHQWPQALLQAVISSEDKNFYNHYGLDPWGIARAAWTNIRHGRVIQGGSTITQQLVKILVKRKGRGLRDKIYEGLLAIGLEIHYSKREILSAYLNNLYLGQVGPFAVYGMGAAAQYYFGEKVDNLSTRQSALLAGIIRAPNRLSPLYHPRQAAVRAETVLLQMRKKGYLGQTLVSDKKISENPEVQINGLLARAWYIQQLEKELDRIDLYQNIRAQSAAGIHLLLGLDPVLQLQAQQIVNKHLNSLEKKKNLPPGSLQGAVVALDPESGAVKALIGGRDYRQSQFNRASSARRQIGSLVKPFVYLTAMTGEAKGGVSVTQATLVRDSPLVVNIGKKSWRPRNFDHRFKGWMTLRRALAESRNIPAVRMGLKGGAGATGALIRRLGISENPKEGPALFLGAVESTPMKMAAAYAVFANGGLSVGPALLQEIIRRDISLYRRPPGKPVIKSESAYIITDMLKNVFIHGTAKSAKKYAIPMEVAGKTGTSSNLRDGWFAGYSPSLVTVVWVGRDDNRKMGLTGATSGLPVWAQLMARFGGVEGDVFPVPAGIEFGAISGHSTISAANHHKNEIQVAYLRGTVPGDSVHRRLAMIRAQRPKPLPKMRIIQKYKYFR